MKRSEINARLAKGTLVLLGQYRGSKVEARTWLDKETGRKRDSQIAHHNLELENGSEVVRIVEYFEAGQEISPIAKQGDIVVVFPVAVERNKGSIVCRASRKDIHTVEE